MTTHYRCPQCEHRARRIVSATVKRDSRIRREITAEDRIKLARQHKKPCHCECHVTTKAGRTP